MKFLGAIPSTFFVLFNLQPLVAEEVNKSLRGDRVFEFAQHSAMGTARRVLGDVCTASEMCEFIANELPLLPNPHPPARAGGICVSQLATEKGCHGKVTSFALVQHGSPGSPELVTNAICDACGLDPPNKGSGELSYSEEKGFTFCFTLGGSVTWQSPPVVGPEWEGAAEGQWCWDSKKTTTVSTILECHAGTKYQASVYKTKRQMKAIMTKEYSQRIKFEWNSHPCAQPTPAGFPRYVEDVCTTETDEMIDHEYTYTFDFDTLPCPEAPPSSPPTPCPVTPGPSYQFNKTQVDETHVSYLVFEDPLPALFCAAHSPPPAYVAGVKGDGHETSLEVIVP